MALSSHELLLILRARDEASSVLRGFAANIKNMDNETVAAAQNSIAKGRALATVGVGLAAVGIAGVAGFNAAANAAIAYDQQAAKTLTQTDKVAVSLQQIKDMGRSVAATVPTDFNTVQDVLYDIFSSINTDAPGAALLLKNIAMAAVGGQADVGTVAKATLAILNAYKLNATDVTSVNDVMFQLVRKGVGTYTDFTNAIGRSIPSAVKAGQSLQGLSGMMAFLTRNGLSAANASTSAARALDALSNPKTAANMKQDGIALTDLKGNFLPVTQIVQEMQDKLKGLSPALKATKLNDWFKGSGGTIQAMRFFNLAVNDTNGLLPEMTADMYAAQGAAAEAYKTMSNTPAAQIQLLKNRFSILKTEIGDYIIPIKEKLIVVVSKLIGLFLNLPKGVQKAIIMFALVGSVLLIIIGTVLALVGSFMILSGSLALMGTSLGAVLLIGGEVVLVLLAIAAAAYLIYKNWDTLKNSTIQTWKAIKDYMTPVVEYMSSKVMPIVRDVVAFFIAQWNKLEPVIVAGALRVIAALKQFVSDIRGYLYQARDIFNGTGEAIKHIFNAWVAVQKWGWGVMKPILAEMVKIFMIVFPIIVDVIVGMVRVITPIIGGMILVFRDLVQFITALINGDWSKAWHYFKQIFIDQIHALQKAFNAFIPAFLKVLQDLMKGIWSILETLPGFFGQLFMALNGWLISAADKYIIQPLLRGLVSGWKSVLAFFKKWGIDILLAIAGLPLLFIELAVGLILAFKDSLIKAAVAVWDWFKALPKKILDAIGDLGNLLKQAGIDMFDGFFYGIGYGIGLTLRFLINLPSMLLSAMESSGKASAWLLQKGIDIVTGLWQGFVNIEWIVIDWFTKLPGRILAIVATASVWLLQTGTDIVMGALHGIANAEIGIWNWFTALPGRLLSYFKNSINWLNGSGKNIITGLRNGIVNSVQAVWDFCIGVQTTIARLFSDSINWLYNAGINVMKGLANGIVDGVKGTINIAKRAAGDVLNGIKGGLGIKSPSKYTFQHGKYVMQGLSKGMKAEYSNVRKTISFITSGVNAGLGMVGAGYNGPTGTYSSGVGIGVAAAAQGAGGRSVVFQAGAVVTQEINPTKHAADLGWLISSKV